MTPWPCFMIAVRKAILDNHFDSVQRMLNSIQEACHIFESGGEESINYISKKYNLQKEDAKQWFSGVKYSRDGSISRKVLVKTMDTLTRAKLLPKEKSINFSQLYDHRVILAPVDSAEIQTLNLFYAQRIKNELKELGKESGTLTIKDLEELDQV